MFEVTQMVLVLLGKISKIGFYHTNSYLIVDKIGTVLIIIYHRFSPDGRSLYLPMFVRLSVHASGHFSYWIAHFVL